MSQNFDFFFSRKDTVFRQTTYFDVYQNDLNLLGKIQAISTIGKKTIVKVKGKLFFKAKSKTILKIFLKPTVFNAKAHSLVPQSFLALKP